ncbi:CHY zinc finger protein [Natronomonas sp. EA1]|uniref:CHY zinc finger protein n=1 Tax=Natronomonas sp. EA1 TaxID=3421655 RepID=UPI003EBEFF8A
MSEGETVTVGDTTVHGIGLDIETRCAHYATERDIIAIRFACCDRYFACAACHAAIADHDAEPIPNSAFDEPGVLCGACGSLLSVSEYLESDHACPACGAAFNPGCAAHYDRYFAGVG